MTGKTVLITRPLDEGTELADALHEHGFGVIHEPLTQIFLNHTARQSMELALRGDPDAVIVTSRYGVQAMAALTEMRDMQMICIGETTADAAQSHGFDRVSVAGGDGERMLQYIVDAYDAGSRFLYASGQHVRTDMVGLLSQFGMQAERLVVYEAVAMEQLSDTLLEHLKREHIDAVTFLSTRATEIFQHLLKKAKLHGIASNMQAYCLSKGVAAPLAGTRWKKVHIAKQPTLASLVECVDNGLH